MSIELVLTILIDTQYNIVSINLMLEVYSNYINCYAIQ